MTPDSGASAPRVVFGMPAYKRPDTLGRTLESLLLQTYRDFAIVIADDCPSSAVKEVVETYSALDSRIRYEPNPTRLGMVGNWRQAFERSRALFPGCQYFAWVSDHDIWHPRWLEVLVGVLDAHPHAVLAYPQMQRMYPATRRAITRLCDTAGIAQPLDRLRVVIKGMTAGNCVYGLFRASALAQAGVFRPVLAPDRQLLVQLALLGEFRQVPEILWYREVAGVFSYERQRQMFFPTRVPLHTYLPAHLQHFGVLAWDLGVRGRGRPVCGRLQGLRYSAAQLWYATKRELMRDGFARWRLRLGQRSA